VKIVEAPAKFAISVIPAKTGLQDALKNWIPGRAPLARNDDILHFLRLMQEALLFIIEEKGPPLN
jgi:hypothetical protein